MATLVRFLFSHGGMIVSLVTAALWWVRRPASRVRRGVLASVTAFFTLASIYYVPYGLSRLLVRGLQPVSAAAVPAGTTAIVVLGSGAMYLADWDDRQVSFPDLSGASRVAEAARVFSLVPGAWIISSGGRVNSRPGAPTTGATMRDALVQLGVPATRIVVEDQSLTTRDEAVLVAPMLRSNGAATVVLVTSDFHMRRSLATFRAAGIDGVPAIARDPFVDHPWWDWVLPSQQALLFSGSVVHEMLAFVLYTARGWM